MYRALCLYRDQLAHIKPVEQFLKGEVAFEYTNIWTEDIIEQQKPDILIGINEYQYEMALCYQHAQKKGIPTLTLQDGILEWRFMFENPMYDGNHKGVPMHFPILADKYACIGHSFAHLIANLGNSGKVEITGMPKLDAIKRIERSSSNNKPVKKKILILSANKPWFTIEQKETVLQMLLDVKNYLSTRDDIEVTWRVTQLLFKELDVQTSFQAKDSIELLSQIKESDAVISMPSTAVLESMLAGKPTALLDYFNVPKLLSAAWNINHSSQIESTIQQLLNPSERQLWMQDTLLRAMSPTDSKSTERVAELIIKMIKHAKNDPGKPYPKFILPPIFQEQNDLNPLHFYPERNVYQISEVDWLHAKLVRLEREKQELQHQLNKQSFTKIILGVYSKLMKIIITKQKNG